MAASSNNEVSSLEQQIEILQQRLAQAQKMAALGELVSTTTHEFNNVLMTVINYAKMGLRHRDDATRDKSLQKILDAGNRAAKITATVLGLARNRSDSYEATDLARLVDDSLMLLEREMNKYRISVEKQFEQVPDALLNGNLIQQVLLNFLVNARQAMPEGGRLLIKIVHDASANTVDLVIRDTGKGIPADQLPRIFEPYFTTKSGPDASGKGGTGLGLATCREIIESHNGRIRVESTIGKGTAFTIKLPVAVKKPSPLVTGVAAPSPLASNSNTATT